MSDVVRGTSPCYCINVRRMSGAISHIYDFYLKPIGLSGNQYALIVDLGRLGSASTTDIANFVGLNRSTLVRTLRPLVEKGLIVDKSVAGKRNREFELTPSGVETVKRGQALWLAAQALIESELGMEKIEQLKEIVGKIENLENKVLQKD